MRAVDDTAWNRVGWKQVRQAAPAGNEHASVLFLVERGALEGGYPIQITDLREASRRPFRCIARELWRVDDNLNIANMDWGSSQEEQTARVTSGGCLTVLAASMYWEQAAAESIDRSNHEILQLPPRVSRFFADSRQLTFVRCSLQTRLQRVAAVGPSTRTTPGSESGPEGIGIILPRRAPVAACIRQHDGLLGC
ncbi:DUF6924 domain-containing protein [Arthrobacter humicola]|uniref:DUF6924 domain-containing protein n=1 Tax=Arthrobacter humicola TaxID=409291 RepID=UPI003F76202A